MDHAALTPTEHVLLLAAQVWGPHHAADLWDLFPPERRAALGAGWARRDPVTEPGTLLERLRAEHAAQSRPDLARVHVSWWARALQAEPESVRSAVESSLPPALADALRAELGPSSVPLTGERPPHPFAFAAVKTLWTERLVGDVPYRADDPPVIAALTELDAPTITALILAAGLAKWTVVAAPDDLDDRPPVPTVARLLRHLGTVTPDLRASVSREAAPYGQDGHTREAGLGLTTFARLLTRVDPYRLRWALQHGSYTMAKRFRKLMATTGPVPDEVFRFENNVLHAGWEHLRAAGRIDRSWSWGGPS